MWGERSVGHGVLLTPKRTAGLRACASCTLLGFGSPRRAVGSKVPLAHLGQQRRVVLPRPLLQHHLGRVNALRAWSVYRHRRLLRRRQCAVLGGRGVGTEGGDVVAKRGAGGANARADAARVRAAEREHSTASHHVA